MDPSPTAAGARNEPPIEDSEDTSTLDFDVALPGTDEPVSATVTNHGGAIEVPAYPSEVTLVLRYTLLTVGFEEAFSSDFCESIRALAEVGPEAEELVRHRGSAVTQVPLCPSASYETRSKLVAAATQARGGSAYLTNPLVLTSASISLELGPDAISRVLGDEAGLLEPFTRVLEQQDTDSLGLDHFSVSVAAKDLLCDLAEGNAQLHIDVSGSFGDESFEGRTTVVGLEPL
jgi:hypothetical protein